MTTGTFQPGDYTAEEVQALVTCWDSVRLYKHRLAVLIRVADLERCVRKLPHKERQAIVLHGMMGYTCQDIADGVDVTGEAVRLRYHRGLVRLQLLMNGHGW
jgi:DNA-directed RNA polymerase specialized sigma24 family protein